MKRGEVWWVSFDPAQGSEITKTRPAVIISNDVANRHLSRLMVVPLTSNTSQIYPAEAFVSVLGKKAKAMADQMMASDKSRFKAMITTLSSKDIGLIEEAIKLHLGLR